MESSIINLQGTKNFNIGDVIINPCVGLLNEIIDINWNGMLIKLRNLLLVVLAIFNVLEFYGAMYVGGDWIFIVGTNGVLLLIIIFINVLEE
jgi:hypothetical protein